VDGGIDGGHRLLIYDIPGENQRIIADCTPDVNVHTASFCKQTLRRNKAKDIGPAGAIAGETGQPSREKAGVGK
jgi:hypothetical protein